MAWPYRKEDNKEKSKETHRSKNTAQRDRKVDNKEKSEEKDRAKNTVWPERKEDSQEKDLSMYMAQTDQKDN